MDFEFATATRIIFGPGRSAEIGTLARALGQRALLVVGADPARADGIRDRLAEAGVSAGLFPVTGEPSVAMVSRGAELARADGHDLVVACGGGSVIDAGKAIAALATNPGDPLEFLEVVGQGRPLRAARSRARARATRRSAA
jgi:alcohol dehydrogenase class IV